MTKRLHPGNPVLMMWDDPSYDASDTSEVGKEKDDSLISPMFTLGWYGKRSRSRVHLWTDKYELKEEGWTYKGRLSIPRSNLLKVIPLPEAEEEMIRFIEEQRKKK